MCDASPLVVSDHVARVTGNLVVGCALQLGLRDSVAVEKYTIDLLKATFERLKLPWGEGRVKVTLRDVVYEVSAVIGTEGEDVTEPIDWANPTFRTRQVLRGAGVRGASAGRVIYDETADFFQRMYAPALPVDDYRRALIGDTSTPRFSWSPTDQHDSGTW